MLAVASLFKMELVAGWQFTPDDVPGRPSATDPADVTPEPPPAAQPSTRPPPAPMPASSAEESSPSVKSSPVQPSDSMHDIDKVVVVIMDERHVEPPPTVPVEVTSNRADRDRPTPPRLTYTVQECASMLGVSTDLVYDMNKSGMLRSVRVGRRLLVSAQSLHQLLDEGFAQGG